MPKIHTLGLGLKVSLAEKLATTRSGAWSRFGDLRLPTTFFPGCVTYSVKKVTPHTLAADRSALFVVARKHEPLRKFNNGKPVVVDGMLNTVQVVCTPTADTPGAGLVVHFGTGDRYFFGNVSEGSQRIMNQRKVPMSRIESIFITGRIDTHSVGGVLGMILTVADVRSEYIKAMQAINTDRKEKGKTLLPVTSGPLRISGGKNLVHAIATARCFVFRKGMPMGTHEIVPTQASPTREDATPDWQDANLRVWQVPLTPEGWQPEEMTEQRALDKQIVDAVVGNMFGSNWSLDKLYETMLHEVQLPAKIFVRDSKGHLQKYEGPLPGGSEPCRNIPVLVRKPWPASNTAPLPDTTPAADSLCYIVKGHAQRGKFLPQKALELGVEKTSFKVLVEGKNVYGKNAVIVTPDMVMEPTVPGNGFAIVDIRYSNLIESFLARPEWSNTEIMEGIEAFYWILSDEVKGDQRIIDWIKGHPSQKHFVFGHGISPNYVAFESPTALIIKMHEIDPDRFPIPRFQNKTIGMPEALAPITQVAQPGETLKLKPKLVFDKESIIPVMDTRRPLDEVLADKEIMTLVEAARQRLADPAFIAQVEREEADMPSHNVEVVSLGTGSALPSKYRNVSANLIRVPGYGSYLLDCGENTLGQLRRLYGFEGADRIIEDLHAIYISHSHADHHLGTASVLARRAELAKANPLLHPVAFVGTRNMVGWLKEYQKVQDLGFPNHVTIEQPVIYQQKVANWRREPALYGEVSLPNFDVCTVDHCVDALAVVLTWPTGLKIAYSGDCRPSKEFAHIGHGAHLLIHESTFDSELVGEAIAKKHSTMAEALEVGKLMNARRILLTHFSQRYPKFPNVEATDQTVLFAFDLMSVKLHEFKKAELFLPALRQLFVDEHYGKEDDAPIEEELDVCVPAVVEEQQQQQGKKKKGKKGKSTAPEQPQQKKPAAPEEEKNTARVTMNTDDYENKYLRLGIQGENYEERREAERKRVQEREEREQREMKKRKSDEWDKATEVVANKKGMWGEKEGLEPAG
ncbi:hypothetical protein B0T16DRAFT_412046 [Cercophora newfieldiana]|uniref:ribonuclease Z n=1 Tax=Cercophora newfieldiana TaxID=92897 RepID=A0AA40CQT8_9PEZI|nr:hypothetical protein B0T16DRAFT_412046 [Cercophora newfieldiana]